jgi:glycosyltransferase involved in cell wall biosynthesis
VLHTLVKNTSAEIVVSDNSDQALTAETLAGLGHKSRLIYQHHSEKLSVVDNFERGLQLATGEYLIFIGDDDCVGPEIERITAWAHDENIDAVVSYRNRFIANYFWPDVKSKYFGNGYAGKMFVMHHTGNASKLDVQGAIREAAGRPGSGLGSMARAYHGIVSRTLVNRVVDKYGQLFGGVSPDIYSATLLSYEAQNAYVLDYPFVIPGASPVSTAGEGAARQDTDNLKGREHILRFGNQLKWDTLIPAFYSPITVWAYSHHLALQIVNNSSLTLNFPSLYLRCLFYNWSYRDDIKVSLRQWKSDSFFTAFITSIPKVLVIEFMALVKRVWYKFISPPTAFSDLESIGDAYMLLEKKLPPWRRPFADSGKTGTVR